MWPAVWGALVLCGASAHAAGDVGAAEGRLLGRAEGSNSRVYWACRFGACRVNIAIADRGPAQTAATGSRITVGPPTQVWVLKADGSHIPGLRVVPTDIGASNFEFPLSAQEEAFAVVVRIGDRLHTWWLEAESASAK